MSIPFRHAFAAQDREGFLPIKSRYPLAICVLLGILACTPSANAGSRNSITVDGRPRTYEIHVPVSYKSDQPVPLVLVLHGRLGNGKGTLALTHFDKVADAHNFIAVFPDGLHRGWADGRGATDSDKQGVSDIHFLRELIRKVSTGYRVDRSRIYVTGISNGGFMSQHVACEMSDQIAAVGIVAATMGEHTADGCHPASPVSVMFFQGTKDSLVPIGGGTLGRGGSRGAVLSLDAAAEKWVTLNGCKPAAPSSALPDKAGDGTIVRSQKFSGCNADTEVIVYTIEDGGHTWPGGKQYLPEMMVGKTTRNIDASEALWDFFSRHTR